MARSRACRAASPARAGSPAASRPPALWRVHRARKAWMPSTSLRCTPSSRRGGVEIPELGQGEGQPPARGDVRDRRLGAGVGGARALERVDILPQDESRAPVLALGVAAVAEIAAGQR